MVFQPAEFYAKITQVTINLKNLNMSNEKQIKEVKKIFEHVSIETFIKYFYQFQSNKGTRSNSIVLEAFKANNESWGKKGDMHIISSKNILVLLVPLKWFVK